jgi:hypothetical protein
MPLLDWRKPGAKAKRAIADTLLEVLALEGRYLPYDRSSKATVPGEAIHFFGDVPRCAGTENFQRRLRYKISRPRVEAIEDIIYTPSGQAWSRGTLVQRFSARAPSVVEALSRIRRGGAEYLDDGCLIESEWPYTYGDWVGDHLRALTEVEELSCPIVLPGFLARKTYVKRDLGRLGLLLVSADKPIRIGRAHILRKTIPSYYWGPEQADAYRRRFGFAPVAPRPGSLLYLSREGVTSEAIDRKYPSAKIAQIVRGLGGTVFDTREASPDAFAQLAGEAETVIADQGSAVFGVLQWQTRNLIEISTEDWWHNASLFFASASRVRNYAIMVCNRYSESQIEARLLELLNNMGIRKP